MKKIDGKIIIISITLISLIGGGAIYATQPSVKADLERNKAASAKINIEQTPPTEEPIMQESANQPAITPTPVQESITTQESQQVRSFEEIIADYPNMSSNGTFIQYSQLIKSAYPSRFTESNAEMNIKLISETFASSVTPFVNGKPLLLVQFWGEMEDRAAWWAKCQELGIAR